MNSQSRIEHLSLDDQSTIETIIERFESAWGGGPPPHIEDFVPATEPLRKVALVELIHSDLHFRFKADNETRIEDYWQRFPDLKNDDDVFGELIEAEYRMRQRLNPSHTKSEYWERFPDRHHVLQQIFPNQTTTETARDSQQQFGRYHILRTLGEGAMGAVYLAEDSKLKRQVALKIPKFSENTGDLLERFYQEARTAATLHHPNICPVYDIGEIEGTRYISMAYIKGKPLSALINGSRQLDQRKIAQIICRLAIASAEAHEQGVVHRDLKPANIMIDKKGQPVILDFGLARQMESGDSVRLTQTGQIIGSPAYMSPEQVEESAGIGPPSDIYSLGVILYELLTGELPFQGSIASVLGQIVTRQPVAPGELRKKIDSTLETLCVQMMAKNIAGRPTSMKEVAQQLSHWIKQNNATDESSIGQSITADSSLAATQVIASDILRPGWISRPAVKITAGLSACGLLLAVLMLLMNAPHQTENAEAPAPTVKVAIAGKDTPTTFDSTLPRTPLPDGPPGLLTKLDGQLIGAIHTLTFSPDGRLLACANSDQRFVLDLESGKKTILPIRPPHSNGSFSLAFAPDGKFLFASSKSNVIKYECSSWNIQEIYNAPTGSVYSIAVSHEGKYVAAHYLQGEIRIWDVASKKLYRDLSDKTKHTNMSAITFLPDGRLLTAKGQPDYKIRLWDIHSGLELAHDEYAGKSIAQSSRVINVSSGGKYFLTTNTIRNVLLVEIESGKIIRQFQEHQNRSQSEECITIFLPDGIHIAKGGMGDNYDTITIWNRLTGKIVQRFNDKAFTTGKIAPSPDGRFLVSCGGRYYDGKTQKPVNTGDYALRIWRLPKEVWPK